MIEEKLNNVGESEFDERSDLQFSMIQSQVNMEAGICDIQVGRLDNIKPIKEEVDGENDTTFKNHAKQDKKKLKASKEHKEKLNQIRDERISASQVEPE